MLRQPRGSSIRTCQAPGCSPCVSLDCLTYNFCLTCSHNKYRTCTSCHQGCELRKIDEDGNQDCKGKIESVERGSYSCVILRARARVCVYVCTCMFVINLVFYVFPYLFVVLFNCLFIFPNYNPSGIGNWDVKDNDIVVVHGRNLRAKPISNG